MKRTLPGMMLGALLMAFLIMLGGCETAKGMGRDISNFGKLISGD